MTVRCLLVWAFLLLGLTLGCVPGSAHRSPAFPDLHDIERRVNLKREVLSSLARSADLWIAVADLRPRFDALILVSPASPMTAIRATVLVGERASLDQQLARLLRSDPEASVQEAIAELAIRRIEISGDACRPLVDAYAELQKHAWPLRLGRLGSGKPDPHSASFTVFNRQRDAEIRMELHRGAPSYDTVQRAAREILSCADIHI